jgi:hypothetical protein
MVARLDERLKENPDADGWQRLVRSYRVLGKTDAARDALARGVATRGPAGRAIAGVRGIAWAARPMTRKQKRLTAIGGAGLWRWPPAAAALGQRLYFYMPSISTRRWWRPAAHPAGRPRRRRLG